MAKFEVKRFKELDEKTLDKMIDIHFNHWVKFNPKMEKEQTIEKFKHLYTGDELPFGIAMFEDGNLVGFCTFKIKNLNKYPDIFPWLSDVMILPEYRGKGYGKKLIELGQTILKDKGYKKIYVWTDQAPDFYKKLGFKYKMQVEKNEGGFGELFEKDVK